MGKCNPAVEEELRVYIGRFPGEVRSLLASGKQVYKQLLANQRHGGTEKNPDCRAAPGARQDRKGQESAQEQEAQEEGEKGGEEEAQEEGEKGGEEAGQEEQEASRRQPGGGLWRQPATCGRAA